MVTSDPLRARMVADFFEMAGWDGVYLGANTPASARPLCFTGAISGESMLIVAVPASQEDMHEAIGAVDEVRPPQKRVADFCFEAVPDFEFAEGNEGGGGHEKRF